MSASLVGSEMCIRDRIWNQSRGALRTAPSEAVGSETRQSASIPAFQCIAVSYTHLTLPTICSV
eukprot:2712477-Alexandrium_andersonii.AAC.1